MGFAQPRVLGLLGEKESVNKFIVLNAISITPQGGLMLQGLLMRGLGE